MPCSCWAVLPHYPKLFEGFSVGEFFGVEEAADEVTQMGPVLAGHRGCGFGIALFADTDELVMVFDGFRTAEETREL